MVQYWSLPHWTAPPRKFKDKEWNFWLFQAGRSLTFLFLIFTTENSILSIISVRNRNTLGKYDIFLPILFLVSFKPLKQMLLQEQPYACHVSLLFWHNATFLLFPNVYRGWDFFILSISIYIKIEIGIWGSEWELRMRGTEWGFECVYYASMKTSNNQH